MMRRKEMRLVTYFFIVYNKYVIYYDIKLECINLSRFFSGYIIFTLLS